mmetsp:Transcript_19669/g.37943  ORF Transcript_19669/g.37943 Transcript_19669/m.37943 type:complete len:86 (+) Transcript_19669:1003-1260(+)
MFFRMFLIHRLHSLCKTMNILGTWVIHNVQPRSSSGAFGFAAPLNPATLSHLHHWDTNFSMESTSSMYGVRHTELGQMPSQHRRP